MYVWLHIYQGPSEFTSVHLKKKKQMRCDWSFNSRAFSFRFLIRIWVQGEFKGEYKNYIINHLLNTAFSTQPPISRHSKGIGWIKIFLNAKDIWRTLMQILCNGMDTINFWVPFLEMLCQASYTATFSCYLLEGHSVLSFVFSDNSLSIGLRSGDQLWRISHFFAIKWAWLACAVITHLHCDMLSERFCNRFDWVWAEAYSPMHLRIHVSNSSVFNECGPLHTIKCFLFQTFLLPSVWYKFTLVSFTERIPILKMFLFNVAGGLLYLRAWRCLLIADFDNDRHSSLITEWMWLSTSVVSSVVSFLLRKDQTFDLLMLMFGLFNWFIYVLMYLMAL